MNKGATSAKKCQGLSLVGFIFVIALVAFVAVLGMKVVPSVVEYSSIKKALVRARDAGSSPQAIRTSFDKQAVAGYIDSISGKDLEISRTDDGGYEVSVAYEKKIALVGPASLLIDYAASTGPTQGGTSGQ